MSLLREAFWREYVLVVLATVLIGAGAAAGVASALDVAFQGAAQGLLGTAGQYHLLVHVRQDYRVAAARELPRVVTGRYPGVVVEEALTVAGNANFLLAMPEPLLQQAVLEELVAILTDVPGFNGYTWLLEPSLTVSGLRPGVQELVVKEASTQPGVRLAVRHGSSVTVLLDGVEERPRVEEALARLLAGRQVAELRFLDGGGSVDGARLLEDLRAVFGGGVVTVTAASEADGPWSALGAVRELLAAATTRVRIDLGREDPPLAVGDRLVLQGAAPEPPAPGMAPAAEHLIVEVIERTPTGGVGLIVHGDVVSPEGDAVSGRPQPAFVLTNGVVGENAGQAFLESPRLAADSEPQVVQQLKQMGQAARAAAERLDQMMAVLAPDGDGDVVQSRAERLARALRSGDGVAAVRETLMSVALSALLRTVRAPAAAGDDTVTPSPDTAAPGAGGAGAGGSAHGDSGAGGLMPQLEELRDALLALAVQAEALEQGEAAAWWEQISSLHERLLDLRDDELTRVLQAVDGAAGGAGVGPRFEVLVERDVSEDALAQAVRAITGREVAVVTTGAGVVSASPRSMVMELLADVRRSVAGLLALLAAAAALVLDHATVLAALKRLSVPAGVVKGVAAILGAALAGGTYVLAGASIPRLGPGAAAASGAVLGLATVLWAERLSPVHAEEILAGQSLGLSAGQILREIVVPAGRPGLLVLVNRWRREFR